MRGVSGLSLFHGLKVFDAHSEHETSMRLAAGGCIVNSHTECASNRHYAIRTTLG